MLNCVCKGIDVEVGERVETWVGVRLGGILVCVRDGSGVKVGEEVGVCISVGFITARVTLCVGLKGGTIVWQASRRNINDSKMRERGIYFIIVYIAGLR